MHAEHMLVDGEKMSKSLGNVYLLKNFAERNFSPLDFRYFAFSVHYRTRFNFTWEALEAAKTGRRTLLNAYWAAEVSGDAPDPDLMERFWNALSDDLGSPRALALMHEASKLEAGVRRSTMDAMDVVLDILEPMQAIPPEVQQLVAEREEARSNKQFVQSDALRAKIAELGYDVEDLATGPRITPTS
jgi:cysteinyl-tRNA synthetase